MQRRLGQLPAGCDYYTVSYWDRLSNNNRCRVTAKYYYQTEEAAIIEVMEYDKRRVVGDRASIATNQRLHDLGDLGRLRAEAADQCRHQLGAELDREER